MIFHLFEVQKHNFFTFGIIVMTFDICIAECDEYIRIFEYSNIFDPNIYSDIRSYHFLDTNIFGYSFVSTFWIRIYSDIRS